MVGKTRNAERTVCRVGLKIEIHEIHQNLRNPVYTYRNPLPRTKSNSAERKLNIEIQRNCRKPLTNKRNQSSSGSKNRNLPKRYEIQRVLIEINCLSAFNLVERKLSITVQRNHQTVRH